MPRVAVLGGSGHIGTYLIPRLVERGFDVVNVSRGTAKPYRPHSAWLKVEQITLDRDSAEAEGIYGQRIAELKPDIIVDLISYKPSTAKQVVEAVKGKVEHYLFCSTIWVYGHLTTVPSTEDEPLYPIDEYGRNKLEIEQYLSRLARLEGFPATSFRPGHIVGEGWIPLNPQGNFNPDIYSTIATGGAITLPNLGLETVHHVHADDVAQWIMLAIDNRSATLGECFNTVSSQALSLRGFTEAMYRYFGQEPRISFEPLESWSNQVSESDSKQTLSHITHSPCASIEKSRSRLGYQPRYTSLQAVQESVQALIRDGRVRTKGS